MAERDRDEKPKMERPARKVAAKSAPEEPPTPAVPHAPLKTVYLNVFAPINPTTANKFMAVCAEVIRSEGAECLYILFASPGGDVDAGVAIYNFLRALPVKIVMHSCGSIDSIANVIFHAAEAADRHATPHATFLFHGVALTMQKEANLNRSQIQEFLSQLNALETKIAKILNERCSLSAEEVNTLFLNGEAKDTEFALGKGIIQSISQPQIPKDAKFFSLNLL